MSRSVPQIPISLTLRRAWEGDGVGRAISSSLMLFLTPGVTVRARIVEEDSVSFRVLPGVLDDPYRLVRIEIFLAFYLVFVEDLLVHFNTDSRSFRDRSVSVLDLGLFVDELSFPRRKTIV